MNLTQTCTHLRSTTSRHARGLASAHERNAVLAMFATPGAVLDALAASSPLAMTERNAIVVALLTEHQRASHPLWPALLMCAFEGMLAKLRRRVGGPRDLDLDQRVLGAFLEALASVRPSPYVLLAIRRATEESLFRVLRAERAAPETFAYDEERHAADPFGAAALAKVEADEIVERMVACADAELIDAVVATYVYEESLRDHVARAYPTATPAERESTYQRLWLGRSVFTRDLRERLRPTPPSREAAQAA